MVIVVTNLKTAKQRRTGVQVLNHSAIYEYDILCCQSVLTTMLHFPAKLCFFKGLIHNLFDLI